MSSNSVTAGFKRLVEGDGAAKKVLTAGLAEIIGTAILLFLGCTGCVSGLGVIPSHLQISLTFGLTVMVVIQCIGHLSEAHINPAMTVGSVILGRKTIAEAVIYIVSQLIGAVIGYGLIKVVTPEDRLSLGTGDETKFCVTDLHMDISPSQGLLLEVIATGILMFVACAVWDQRNAKNSDSVAIKFGLTVTVLAATVGPYTGCSMNPVRSFAPALWNNQWHHQWIYLFGPIGGAIFSSVVYRTLFGVEEESENILENVALNSIGTHKSEQM